jgi:hypothetical protein
MGAWFSACITVNYLNYRLRVLDAFSEALRLAITHQAFVLPRLKSGHVAIGP